MAQGPYQGTFCPNKELCGCSAFIVETPVDGNEPVRLHNQDIQVAGDEQEEGDQVSVTGD